MDKLVTAVVGRGEKTPLWPGKDFRYNSIWKPPRIAAVIAGPGWVCQAAQTRSDKRRESGAAQNFTPRWHFAGAVCFRTGLRERRRRHQKPSTAGHVRCGRPAPDGPRT